MAMQITQVSPLLAEWLGDKEPRGWPIYQQAAGVRLRAHRVLPGDNLSEFGMDCDENLNQFIPGPDGERQYLEGGDYLVEYIDGIRVVPEDEFHIWFTSTGER